MVNIYPDLLINNSSFSISNLEFLVNTSLIANTNLFGPITFVDDYIQNKRLANRSQFYFVYINQKLLPSIFSNISSYLITDIRFGIYSTILQNTNSFNNSTLSGNNIQCFIFGKNEFGSHQLNQNINHTLISTASLFGSNDIRYGIYQNTIENSSNISNVTLLLNILANNFSNISNILTHSIKNHISNSILINLSSFKTPILKYSIFGNVFVNSNNIYNLKLNSTINHVTLINLSNIGFHIIKKNVPLWTGTTLPDAIEGQSYNENLPVQGANTISLITGSLPSGLSLSGSSITGTPDPITEDTQHEFVLRATNDVGVTDQYFTILVQNSSSAFGWYNKEELPNIVLDFINLPNESLERVFFQRNSTGTFQNENGELEIAQEDEPRFEFDSIGNRLGLLIEEEKTNFSLYSEDFSNGTWTKNNSSVLETTIQSPNNSNVYKLIEDTSNSTHGLEQTVSVQANKKYTVSVFVKVDERDNIRLEFGNTNFPVNQYAEFDLTNQTIISGTMNVIANIRSFGNDWYRIHLTSENTVSSGNEDIRILLKNGSITYIGDNNSGLYIWGVQIEESYLSSYIKTISSEQTRKRDDVDVHLKNYQVAKSTYGFRKDEGLTDSILFSGSRFKSLIHIPPVERYPYFEKLFFSQQIILNDILNNNNQFNIHDISLRRLTPSIYINNNIFNNHRLDITVNIQSFSNISTVFSHNVRFLINTNLYSNISNFLNTQRIDQTLDVQSFSNISTFQNNLIQLTTLEPTTISNNNSFGTASIELTTLFHTLLSDSDSFGTHMMTHHINALLYDNSLFTEKFTTKNPQNGLTVTDHFSTGTLANLATSNFSRGNPVVFSCDLTWPASWSNGLIFELGGYGVGAGVGLTGNGSNLTFAAGHGSTTATSADTVVLKIPTSTFTPGESGTLTWEIQPTGTGSIRAWWTKNFITTELGYEETTGGGNLDGSTWAGTQDGYFGGKSGTDACSSVINASFPGSFQGRLRHYQNQTANLSFLSNGLSGKRFSGYFADNMDYFLDPASDADGAKIPNDLSVNEGSIPSTTSWQWVGYFIPDTTETYTFYTTSDDSSLVWLGSNALNGYTVSNALVDNSGLHGPTEVSNTISLTAGNIYPIRIMAGNNSGPGEIVLSYSTPTISKTSDGTGRYFHQAEQFFGGAQVKGSP